MLLQDPEDLPFVKDEIITVLRRDEEQWWTARNERGQCGSVPVPYLEKVRLICHKYCVKVLLNLLFCGKKIVKKNWRHVVISFLVRSTKCKQYSPRSTTASK